MRGITHGHHEPGQAACTALSVAVGGSAAWLAIVALPDREFGLLAAVTVGAGVVPGITAYTVKPRAPDLPGIGHPAGEVTLTVPLGCCDTCSAVGDDSGHLPVAAEPADAFARRRRLDAAQRIRGGSELRCSRQIVGPTRIGHPLRLISAVQPALGGGCHFCTHPGNFDDFVDAQWYASPEPVDYVPADLAAATDLEVRSAHSNADNAGSHRAPVVSVDLDVAGRIRISAGHSRGEPT